MSVNHLLSVPKTAVSAISDEYFRRMLSPQALKLSAPYTREECAVLERCLQACPNIHGMNFVAVGGGELWELQRALTYAKQYVCIEPLADKFMDDAARLLVEKSPDVTVLAKRFDEVLPT